MKLEAAIRWLEVSLRMLTVKELVAWADTWIETLDHPPMALIEISLGGAMRENEWLVWLAERMDEPIDKAIAAEVFRGCLISLQSQVLGELLTPQDVVNRLLVLARQTPSPVPTGFVEEIEGFERAFWLVEDGCISRVPVEVDLMKFLEGLQERPVD